MIHTMQIPDWVWEEHKRRSGLANPASAIRDFLCEATALGLGDQTFAEAPSDQGGWRPPAGAACLVWSLKGPSICDWCGRLNQPPMHVVYYPEVKPKRMICLDHYEDARR